MGGAAEWSEDRGKTLASIFRGAKMVTGLDKSLRFSILETVSLQHGADEKTCTTVIHENIDEVCIFVPDAYAEGKWGLQVFSPIP